MSVYPVKLLNVSYAAKEHEVFNFVKSSGVYDMEVFLSLHKTGSHKGSTDGNAFVLVFSSEDVDKCLSLNGKYIRERQVQVIETSLSHMKTCFLNPKPLPALFEYFLLFRLRFYFSSYYIRSFVFDG